MQTYLTFLLGCLAACQASPSALEITAVVAQAEVLESTPRMSPRSPGSPIHPPFIEYPGESDSEPSDDIRRRSAFFVPVSIVHQPGSGDEASASGRYWPLLHSN
ncbi:hypothetical protein R3P38DRAFT_2984355 [Favolaschia claudopus]|uniref:Secreted protein n=1 Tax=Favolaschia claudopus TaxID=2862362 RepID=A0AAW0AWM0_9AGAR